MTSKINKVVIRVQKITLLLTLLLTLALSTVVIIFFDHDQKQVNATPKELYQVYLAGEKIGVIRSKAKLEAYIDKKQDEIKQKYNVKNVYPPKNLSIQKYISYDDDILDEDDIYEKIRKLSPFTIKGWTYRIKNQEEGQPDKVVNVINKETFDQASLKTVEAFVPKEEYKLFSEDKQTEIKEIGKLIEDVYTQEIFVKENYISTDEHIFTDENELAKYLLFGTTEEQEKYIVQQGDTIEDIAFNNKLGTDEFLIVNPQFSNSNSLLFPGQEVSVGLIKPILDVVVEEHIVEDQTIKYGTRTELDSSVAYGVTLVKQEGVDGLERIIVKRQTTNGVITNVQIDRPNSIVLRPAVEKVIVKGTRGSSAPISTDGEWAWPTNVPYYITSYYEYRWGGFHHGIDISGTGYGSPIRAAREGVVVFTGKDSINGNHIIISHENNYYTLYNHLLNISVREGQTVKKAQIIGTMGNSGYVKGKTGVHLHFGLYVGRPFTSGSRSANPLLLYK